MMQPSEFTERRRRSALVPLTVVLVALVATALVAFGAGFAVSNANSSNRVSGSWTTFWEAWDTVNSEFYYNKPPEADRVRGAIQGMLATLKDRYTFLIEPQAAASDAQLMSGDLGGIGARVTVDASGQFIIAEALIGKPAAGAGLLSGDIIRAVDSVPVKNGSDLQQLIQRIRGPIGTDVHLTVQRGAKELTVAITRQQVNVYGRMLNQNIAYAALSLFEERSATELTDTLKPLLDQHPRALILDLRGNPGGYLDQAIKVADLFLGEGPVASERSSSGENQTFTAKSGDLAESIPLYVLVDHNSASASEIVSGALKDRHRAVVIGQRTYGKGSVQSIHKLDDGSQLRVTSGAWYTPNNTPIQGIGLPPDIWVSVPDILQPGTDPMLDQAVHTILFGGPDTF